MQRLEGTINLADFKLPRLVVIGNQNRGKSSLLESITKCPIFPRGDDTTTRAPVCLRLQHVPLARDSVIQVSWKEQRTQEPRTNKLMQLSEISGLVKTIMSEIPVNTVVADEIIVHICSPSMMNLEFIDLPGIVAAPAEKQQQTEGLVNKYLQNTETLVICVEEATCGNLDGGQALGLVQRARKSKHTIVALTKCDNLDSTEIRKRLLLRVLRSSGEITDVKQKDTDFAGCVAVINRSHHDVKTLLEAGDEEQSTFENQVFAKYPAMPQQFAKVHPPIQTNLGISNLIAQVEAMYSSFVMKDWKRAALQQLGPIMMEVKQQMDALGIHPRELTISKVMQALQKQIDFESVAHFLSIDSFDTAKLITVTPVLHTPAGMQVTMPIMPLRALWGQAKPVATNSLAQAVQLKDISKSAMQGIDSWLKDAPYLEILRKAVTAAFSNSNFGPMRLDRFESLKEEITLRGLKRAVQTEQIKNSIMLDLQPFATLLRLNYGADIDNNSIKGELVAMERAVYFALFQEVILPLQISTLQSCVPDSFPLHETAAVQRARSYLEDCQRNLQHAHNIIRNIEQEVNAANAGAIHNVRCLIISNEPLSCSIKNDAT